MTERVLTDAELEAAYKSTPPNIHFGLQDNFTASLRAVEQAVLAKAEVETREREREAFKRGVAAERARPPLGDCRMVDNVIDSYYPSLRPPASVTLSTGTWYRDPVSKVWSAMRTPTSCHTNYIYAPCANADDHAKVLAYLQAMEGK